MLRHWMNGCNGCSVLILPLTPEYEGTAILRNVDNNAFYVTTNSYNPNAETNALACLVASAVKASSVSVKWTPQFTVGILPHYNRYLLALNIS